MVREGCVRVVQWCQAEGDWVWYLVVVMRVVWSVLWRVVLRLNPSRNSTGVGGVGVSARHAVGEVCVVVICPTWGVGHLGLQEPLPRMEGEVGDCRHPCGYLFLIW